MNSPLYLIEKEKEKQVIIERALLTAKYKVLDASLDNSPIKSIENEVITTLEKGLSRQHLHGQVIQMVYNPNGSESSPQVDEASYQSNNSVTNSYQVGSTYIERQQKAKNYGRIQAGSESNKNKKNPVIPAKYQHLFKSNMPGSDKYHSNVKKPDGKYPNYLPQHTNIKHENRSGANEGYAYTYENINNLADISNRYKAAVPNHQQKSNPQCDPNNDGDAYFLDDGMEGMDIDGESTVSQIVFSEWGEDPVNDDIPDDGVDNSNITNNTYASYDDDDNNPEDSHGSENVWRDYYYEDHEGNVVLDLSNRFDAVEIPQYVSDEHSRNHADIHNNHEFYNDLDKYNAGSPLSPYQDFPDKDRLYDEDYEYSNEYEDTKQYDDDDDLLTSTEQNEVTFYNNGRALDRYDYALDISVNRDDFSLVPPLNNNVDRNDLVVHRDTVDDENHIFAEHADDSFGSKIIDTSIGVMSSPGTDVAVVTDEDGGEYADDFEEIGNSSSNLVSLIPYHVVAGAEGDASIHNDMQSTTESNVELTSNINAGNEESSYNDVARNAAPSPFEEKVCSHVDTTIVIENTPPHGQAGIDTVEASAAATRLQSQVRRKQSKKRVEEMKKGNVVADSVVSTEEVKPVPSSNFATTGDRNAGIELIKAARQRQQHLSTKPVQDVPKRAGSTATSVPKPDSNSIPKKATGIPKRKIKSVNTVKSNTSNEVITESDTAMVTSNGSNDDAAILSSTNDEAQKRIMKEKRNQALASLKKKKLPNNVDIVPACIA